MEPVIEQAVDGHKGWFSDHRADITEAGDIKHLTWRKPGTSVYRVDYFMWQGNLFVSGDIGDAVYQWASKIDLKFLATCDLAYFAGKCQASPYGRGFKSWDQERALWSLEGRDPDRPDLEKNELIKEATGSQGAWIEFLGGDEATDILGEDLCEYGSIGLAPDYFCVGQWQGLKMAHAQLTGEQINGDSRRIA